MPLLDPGAAREKRWVVGLLILALMLRLGFVLMQPSGFYFFDSVEFDRAARTLLDLGRFHHSYEHLPGYPIFMAGVYALFGREVLPLRLVQALLSTGLCALIWLLGRRLFGRRAGLLALALCVFFPVQIVLPGIEYPLVVGSLAIWGGLTLQALRSGEPRRDFICLAGAGVLIGAACLTFEAGWAAAVFMGFWLLMEGGTLKRRAGASAVFTAAVLVTAIPFLVGMAESDDFRPVLKRAGVHLPAAPDSDAPLSQGNGTNLVEAKLTAMAERPGFTLKHIASEFVRFWNPYPDRLWAASAGFREKAHREDARMRLQNPLVTNRKKLLYAAGFSVLLAGAALGAFMARRKVVGWGFLAGWPVALGLAYAPFFTQMRYRIPADPAFFLLAAYAADQLLEGELVNALRSLPAALWEGWKRVALKIALVQTFLLLALLFGLVLGPLSLLMKLFRKDPMEGVVQGSSFWVVREKTSEGLQECLRQF
ncbi:MAG TPA: glycosyltransferase family 39 protein [Candidatus Polarisedimenticolia bacterium]|nr:glycosyltransferase family 39 protein [Candidatus Polarisedimenticolia bacterium]